MPHDPRPRILGAPVDDETRCVHYHGPADVVAIEFACCRAFYPCIHCHAAHAGHPAQRWPAADFGRHAILCGACGTTLPIRDYLAAPACPACGAGFNPACASHHALYFEIG